MNGDFKTIIFALQQQSMLLKKKDDQFFKQFIQKFTETDQWNWPSLLETDKVFHGEVAATGVFPKKEIRFIIRTGERRLFGRLLYMDCLHKYAESVLHIRVFSSGKRLDLETYEPRFGYSGTQDLEHDRAEMQRFLDHNIRLEKELIAKGLELPDPYQTAISIEAEKFFKEQINTITGIDYWAWPSPLKLDKHYHSKIYTAGSRGLSGIRFFIKKDDSGSLYMDFLHRTDDYDSHNRVFESGELIRLENYEGQWGRTVTGDDEKDKLAWDTMRKHNEKVSQILKQKGFIYQ
jgi:hypothetical protein